MINKLTSLNKVLWLIVGVELWVALHAQAFSSIASYLRWRLQ